MSLEQTKEAVRHKLKLPAGEDIKLARIESGVHIDLEDGETRESSRMIYVPNYLQTMTSMRFASLHASGSRWTSQSLWATHP